MDVTKTLPLLGGLSPQQFMKRYWQKKPLLVRQAVPGFQPLLDRSTLFELAASDDVQSRLVMQTPGRQAAWQLRHGPFERRQLPPLKKPAWTLLVQGVDLHHEGVHQLLQQFRFVSDARLDDLMISYASDGGGVGPHFDSYDVFLLQAHGRRRWRIGRQKDLTLQDGLPLKILAHFEAEQEYVLEPGDMLYLPPRYAHDGVAEGECMTYSVGFRSPSRAELAREMLHMLSQEAEEAVGGRLYGDAGQPPAAQAGEIPGHLRAFALDALQAVLADPKALDRALGQYLTEPKANVWFDPAEADTHRFDAGGLRLDRRTRMMYDDHQVYINGESFLAKGRDFELMRQLANQRGLSADAYKRLSAGARQLMQDWMDAGWLWRQ